MPVALTKYVDNLPIPDVLKPRSRTFWSTSYKVVMTQFRQQLHRDLPPTTLWGFEGSFPGPTIEVQRGERVKVQWINKLPAKHLFPIDPTQPEVRTVVHLHGGGNPPKSDGYPEAWYTTDYKQVGPSFTTKVYEYPNAQRPAMLWYHDHALGITRLNVMAGLAGMYIIRDRHEKRLNLPSGPYEIPLMIQDRTFHADGSLSYPAQKGFYGEAILVNGKVWPYLEVEPRQYRFRLLNASNARFYRLKLSSGQPFLQIGVDGGLLEQPVEVRELLLAPAERADVIVDFSGQDGAEILLTNDAPAPFPAGSAPDPETTGQVMQVRVVRPLLSPDTSEVPAQLTNFRPLREEEAREHRSLSLVETTDGQGRPQHLLNGLEWDAPITEKPRLHSVEVWRLVNFTTDTQPIHLHLVQFQILDRQPFVVDPLNGQLVYTGPRVPPDENERGWKDTVRADPGHVTRIIASFGPYSGAYPWHGHILDHEDHQMMRPYRVVKWRER